MSEGTVQALEKFPSGSSNLLALEGLELGDSKLKLKKFTERSRSRSFLTSSSSAVALSFCALDWAAPTKNCVWGLREKVAEEGEDNREEEEEEEEWSEGRWRAGSNEGQRWLRAEGKRRQGVGVASIAIAAASGSIWPFAVLWYTPAFKWCYLKTFQWNLFFLHYLHTYLHVKVMNVGDLLVQRVTSRP